MSFTAQVLPRKSARQTRSRNTVDCIVEAAARILEQSGTAHYTTNSVAERAGVSVGSLYQYFPNKDSIVVELWRRSTTSLIENVATASRHRDWRYSLFGMAVAAVKHQLERPGLALLLEERQRHFEQQGFGSPVSGAIVPCIERMLAASQLDLHHCPTTMAVDLFSITRSLTDEAGAAGKCDPSSMLTRVCFAAFGYMRADKGDFDWLERQLAVPARAP
jgi:AcrR family transcriptional regulator